MRARSQYRCICPDGEATANASDAGGIAALSGADYSGGASIKIFVQTFSTGSEDVGIASSSERLNSIDLLDEPTMKIPFGRLAGLLLLWISTLTATAQLVNIPDLGLQAAIREALNKPTGDITVQDAPRD